MGSNGVSIEVEWVYEGSFKGVSRNFQGSFQVVSRRIKGCSKRSLRVIQGRLKVI